jgi:hypothetical protein
MARNHETLEAVETRSSINPSTLKYYLRGQSQMPQACAPRKEEIVIIL